MLYSIQPLDFYSITGIMRTNINPLNKPSTMKGTYQRLKDIRNFTTHDIFTKDDKEQPIPRGYGPGYYQEMKLLLRAIDKKLKEVDEAVETEYKKFQEVREKVVAANEAANKEGASEEVKAESKKVNEEYNAANKAFSEFHENIKSKTLHEVQIGDNIRRKLIEFIDQAENVPEGEIVKIPADLCLIVDDIREILEGDTKALPNEGEQTV